MPTETARAKVRFGPYEFDPATGELRKFGLEVKLQAKSARMLAALVEKPGQLVSRDDLQARLWPDGSFVDFEAGLNTAAKRLRDALSESAGEPRYIETIPRSGYRFIGDISEITAPGLPVEASYTAPVLLPAPPPRRWRPSAWLLASAVAAGALVMWLVMRDSRPAFDYREITFRGAAAGSARFAPDGKTILYTAMAEAGAQVFATNLFAPESRPIPGALGSVVSVSPRGEMLLARSSGLTPLGGSSLWRIPMNGGASVEVDRSVFSAAWAPDGSGIAVARAIDGVCRIEYPAGRILYQTSGYLTNLRFSPDGRRIAFVHHPVRHDDAGSVEVVDLGGRANVLAGGWSSVSGLAWHPETHELWFTAGRDGAKRRLWVADPRGGAPRDALALASHVTIHDIAPDGGLLLSQGTTRLEMAAGGLGHSGARPASWLDWTSVKDVSERGEVVLFEENGDAVRGRSIAYVHRTSTGATVRLGDGIALALTADAKAALLLDPDHRETLRLVPLEGPGRPREWPKSGLTYQWAKLFPGGANLLALASRGAGPLRLFTVDSAGAARELAPPGMVRNAAISPDGKRVAALTARGRLAIYPVDGGASVEPSASGPLAPLLWTARGILVQHAARYTEIPARMSWLDPETGRLTRHAEASPPDTYGVNAITRIVPSPDAAHWVFSYRRVLSTLFWAGQTGSEGRFRRGI